AQPVRAGAAGPQGSRRRNCLGHGARCPVPPRCESIAPNGVGARINLLIARAEAVPVECDLVVKGTLNNEARGWLYRPQFNNFQSDRAAEAPLTDAQLRQVADTAGQALTYTCVPPGSGV